MVSLSSAAPGPLALALAARDPRNVRDALDVAVELGDLGPWSTRDLWETLATVASRDLGLARAIEPHLDAVGIFTQAGERMPRGAWGVFAAEGGDDPLRAQRTGNDWQLTGTKPWCSLAGTLDGALITAADSDGARRLFAVDLHDPGVHVSQQGWVARGLAEIESTPVRFDSVVVSEIAEPGWYLSRPGFSWGGIAVAACWYGGAVGIARTVLTRASQNPDAHLLAHLGAIDEQIHCARRALLEASEFVDAGVSDERVIAKRVRATVARVCEDVLLRAGHALGAAPLALDEAHAKRVADLQLYIRQHHAERDLASLGAALTTVPTPW